MYLDWLAIFLEYSAVLILFTALADEKLPMWRNICYVIASGALAAGELLLQLPAYVINHMPLIIILGIYGDISKKRMLYGGIAVLVSLLIDTVLIFVIGLISLSFGIGNIVLQIVKIVLFLWIHAVKTKIRLDLIMREEEENHPVLIYLTVYGTLLIIQVLILIAAAKGENVVSGSGQMLIERAFFWLIFLYILGAFAAMIYRSGEKNRVKVNILEDKIEDLKSGVSTLRMQMHDQKHHLNQLHSMIATATDLGELQKETGDYISEIENDRKLMSSILGIDQPLLSAAIYGCYLQCRKKEIEFVFSSTDQLPVFPLPDYRLVELFDNLMVNAIEETGKFPAEKRKIELKLKAEGDESEITIINPVYDEFSIVAAYSGRTRKVRGHLGVGVSSINQIVNEYGLDLVMEREDGKVAFTLHHHKERGVSA